VLVFFAHVLAVLHWPQVRLAVVFLVVVFVVNVNIFREPTTTFGLVVFTSLVLRFSLPTVFGLDLPDVNLTATILSRAFIWPELLTGTNLYLSH